MVNFDSFYNFFSFPHALLKLTGFPHMEVIRHSYKATHMSAGPMQHSFRCCSVAQSCPTLCIPWTAALQASLSFTISWSLLILMSIESRMPSNQLILCCPISSSPQSFPISGSFPGNWLLALGGQSIGASASALVLPKTIQS